MAIYFAKAGDAVKIGYAANISLRLPFIRTGNPEEVVLLRALEGGKAAERALHARFADLHIRREWFRYSDEMLGDLGYRDLPPIKQKRLREHRHPLGLYLQNADISIGSFAEQVGVSAQTIYRYLSGDRFPHYRVMQRIMKATQGAITANEMHDYVTAPPAVGAA